MSVPKLSIDEFARSIAVNKHSPHALFLGAGASLTSGMPSAASCVSEWKRRIFISNNPTLREYVSELSLPSVRSRIDNWLRSNGHWPAEGVDDYGYFIEKCHPIASDRARVFDEWVRNAKPHTGYRLLPLLAESKLIRCVWTTNFDGLAAKAAATSKMSVIEIGIDSKQRTFRQPSLSEFLCISLHGDYRYDPLANTPDELQATEQHLKLALIDMLSTHSLIVSGYSGRDASIMTALNQAMTSKRASTKIYWCGFADTPSDTVSQFLNTARASSREAFYIPAAGFDDIISRIATTSLDSDSASQVSEILGSALSRDLPTRQPFTSSTSATTGLLKSNAIPIRLPSEMFAFDLISWPKEKVWDWLRQICASHDIVAVPFRQVLALGTLDAIHLAFAGHIQGVVQRVPIAESELRIENGQIVSLLQQAIIRAIAVRHGLDTCGKHRVWEKKPFKTETRDGRQWPIHRSVAVALRSVGGRNYLTLEPTFHVVADGEDEEAAANLVKSELGYQHNDKYNDDFEHWRKMLVSGDRDSTYGFPSGTAAFQFTLGKAPACAAIANPKHRPIQIPEKWKTLIHHNGVVAAEPQLLFGTRNGRPSSDTLPIRGLAVNGPFDHLLTHDGDRIRISVVCPRAEAAKLEAFLVGAESQSQSLRREKEEYLVPYPGFQAAFRLPLEIPRRQDPHWLTLPEIDSARTSEQGSRDLARNILDAVKAAASIERSVVLILTPARWEHWRGFETCNEQFDVHDFVKAYCVQNGIATQFIKQEKLESPEKCRLWWWLSVALYTKAMRSPWVLEGLDSDTAYVGLGYSIDTKAKRGEQIVLGCSHLYNSHGQGLQFRLSRIENATIRGENAYLSFNDARSMGETIRSLFWEAHQRLPRRVVVHKLFAFRAEEQKGLLAGLEGVDELDLIEINHEPRLRYMNSRFIEGAFKTDGFPVRRGTTLRLSSHEALLWLHGATDAVKPNWTYYQGKRRIPAPVVIRRYAGCSSLGTLASELLGLSKMDWNSGDLYSQLPATVQSSKTIARIGSLLQRFGSDSFDYRLFM